MNYPYYLMTEEERRLLELRTRIARLLFLKWLYADIIKVTGTSSATIAKVKKMMNNRNIKFKGKYYHRVRAIDYQNKTIGKWSDLVVTTESDKEFLELLINNKYEN